MLSMTKLPLPVSLLGWPNSFAGVTAPLILKWRNVVVTAALHHGKGNAKWLFVKIPKLCEEESPVCFWRYIKTSLQKLYMTKWQRFTFFFFLHQNVFELMDNFNYGYLLFVIGMVLSKAWPCFFSEKFSRTNFNHALNKLHLKWPPSCILIISTVIFYSV